MNDFIKRFIGIVKNTGKWAALLAVIITILAFAAEELARWNTIHNPDTEKRKPAVIKEKADEGPDADTSIEEQIIE